MTTATTTATLDALADADRAYRIMQQAATTLAVGVQFLRQKHPAFTLPDYINDAADNYDRAHAEWRELNEAALAPAREAVSA